MHSSYFAHELVWEAFGSPSVYGAKAVLSPGILLSEYIVQIDMETLKSMLEESMSSAERGRIYLIRFYGENEILFKIADIKHLMKIAERGAAKKPPVGLVSRTITAETGSTRMRSILSACDRYAEAEKKIPDGWIIELIELNGRLIDSGKKGE
jgi:hypothetical protein